MKKIISLVLALVMLAAMAVPAFAEGVQVTPNKDGVDKTQDTVVTYGPSASYTVTIPSAIDFSSGTTTTGTVGVNEVYLSPVQQVQVSVKSLTGTAAEVKSKLEAAATGITVTMADASKTAWTLIDIAGNSAAVEYWVQSTPTVNGTAGTQTAKLTNDSGVVISVPGAQAGAATTVPYGEAALAFGTNGTAQVGSYYDLLTFEVDVVDYTPAA